MFFIIVRTSHRYTNKVNRYVNVNRFINYVYNVCIVIYHTVVWHTMMYNHKQKSFQMQTQLKVKASIVYNDN